MKTKVIIDRAEVLKTTWAIIRKSGYCFGEALKRAWKAIQAKAKLATADERGIWITFQKVDGSIRNVLATRNTANIPAEQHGKGGKLADSVVGYYDVWEGTWKSFRADSLISIG